MESYYDLESQEEKECGESKEKEECENGDLLCRIFDG